MCLIFRFGRGLNRPSCSRSRRVIWPALLSLLLSNQALPGQTLPVESPAGERSVTMDHYVVTGTRTPQAADSAPVRVEVAAAADLVRLGARDFADAMEYLPGVQVEANCQNCNTTELRLLGLGGAYNQIAFDGLPLLSSLAGVYGLEQVPAGFIERIEVVKGGGSSLYGANAVAGVINIIPRRPDRSRTSASYRVDHLAGATAQQAEVMFDQVTAQGPTVSAYVQARRQDPVDLNADGFTELTRRRLLVADTRSSWSAGPGTWSLDLNHSHEHRRGGDRLSHPAHLAHITEELETRRTAATLAFAGRPVQDFDYRVVLATAYTERDSFYGGLGDVVIDPSSPAFDALAFADALAVAQRQYGFTRNPLFVAEAQFNHRLSRHTLSWGLQTEYEDLFDQNRDSLGKPTDNPAREGEFINVAAFVQDDWTVRDNLTVLSGLRIDRDNQLERAIVSPRLALRYATSEFFSMRANLSTGFRSPRIFDEDLHINTLGAAPVTIINAPDLTKESATSGTLGFTWNPRSLAEVLAFELNLFAANVDDAFRLSEIRTASDGSLFQERHNSARLAVRGLELSTAYSFTSRLRADLGLTWQHTRLDAPEILFDDGNGHVVASRRPNKTPDLLGVMKLQYENEQLLDWSIAARFTGPMPVLNNTRGTFAAVDAFLVLDATIGKHLAWAGGEHLVQLGVRNLTDARQRDLESGALRDSDYVYGPRHPRTLFVSVQSGW